MSSSQPDKPPFVHCGYESRITADNVLIVPRHLRKFITAEDAYATMYDLDNKSLNLFPLSIWLGEQAVRGPFLNAHLEYLREQAQEDRKQVELVVPHDDGKYIDLPSFFMEDFDTDNKNVGLIGQGNYVSVLAQATYQYIRNQSVRHLALSSRLAKT